MASLEELHGFGLNSSGIGFADMQAKGADLQKTFAVSVLYSRLKRTGFSKLCFSVALPTKICYLYVPSAFVFSDKHQFSLSIAAPVSNQFFLSKLGREMAGKQLSL